jgi:hypothetical protein
VALLAVLACILLLSILVVSFISFTKLNHSSTVEYGNSVQAQEIAQGGLQDIISDLRQEITAGSVVATNAATFVQSGTAVYVPVNNYAAVPARVGYAANTWSTAPTAALFSPTLVRVSRRDATAGGTSYNPPLTAANYPGTLPLNRASAVSTAAASVNGRSISAARWNKTFLLATTSLAVPSPFTAASSASPPTGPPDWVYVTRQGSQVCTTLPLANLKPSSNLTTTTTGSGSPIVGRYAFVMYDEGALLDANVAGSPSTLISASVVQTQTSPYYSAPSYTDPTTGRSLAFSGKSYQAFADLAQLPGLLPTVTGAQAKIDSLVNLRNAAGIAAANSSNGNTYLGAIFNYASFVPSAFTNFTSSGSTSDSPFVSRQDLINYFANIDPNINTATGSYSQALTYLGTFSRSVSAPTYSPPDNASALGGNNGSGNVYAYKDNAEASGYANRDFANIRFAKGGTVTHYYDDQSGSVTPTGTATYSVNVGDPFMQSRFSLSKIGWLSQADPVTGNFTNSSTYANPIQACFGLVWDYPAGNSSTVANGGNKCWNYDGPTGTTPANTIETLDQVAAETPPREPNFFELLKAAILSGSLALNPGQASFDNGKLDIGPANSDYSNNNGNYGTPHGGSDNLYASTMDGHVAGQTASVPSPAQISDLQIIQIGANIIDQYDTDDYPTAIYFQYPALMGTSFDAGSSSYLGEFGPTDMVYGEENLPLLNSVIEPTCTTDGSQPDNTQSPATKGPLGSWWQPELWNPHLQPAATGSTAPPTHYVVKAYGYSKHFNTQSSTSSPVTPLTGQVINVTDSNPVGSAFYAHPYLLTQNTVPGVTCTTASTAAGVAAGDMMGTSVMADEASNPFVGFSMGVDYNYTANPTPGPIANYQGIGAPVATFSLGWSATGTDFHPYSFITGIFAYVYGKDQYAPKGSAGSADPMKIIAEYHRMVDPRARRIPTFSGWLGSVNSTLWPSVTLLPHPGVGGGWGIPPGANFVYSAVNSGSYSSEDWLVNQASPIAQTLATSTYYSDADGVVRPADGLFANASSGEGIMLFLTAGIGSSTALGDKKVGSGNDDVPIMSAAGNSSGINRHARRPVILNRPFRSVGELSYVFRDLPFKTLDFFTGSSADAALLDVFSLSDESKVSNNQIGSVIAGQVDLNNAPLPVIQALLVGESKKDVDPAYNLGNSGINADGQRIASFIATSYLQAAAGPNPILNRAALVTKIQPAIQTISGGAITGTTRAFSSTDKYEKSYLEAPVRALASVTNTRTWNLLIDVIAQSGQIAPSAQSLNDFVVQGERRYWLHVAIDRYTGKIVAQQLEPVYE